MPWATDINDEVLHRRPTPNVTLSRAWAQLGAVRLLWIPCSRARYWRTSVYSRLAPVSMHCALYNWIRAFSLTFTHQSSSPWAPSWIVWITPTNFSTKLPRTKVRTICVFVRGFPHAFRDNWSLDIELGWKIRSITQIRLRKLSKKFKNRKIWSGSHVSPILSVWNFFRALVHYYRDHVRVINNS